MIPLRPFRTSPRALTDIADPSVPDVHYVIITTTRQQLSIGSPLQATDFARVSDQLHNLVSWHPHVVVPNAPITTARR